MKKRSPSQIIAALLLLALVGLYQQYAGQTTAPGNPGQSPAAVSLDASRDGDWVTVSGVVSRTLGDDREGSRHQRFILQLPEGQTLLVAHNIDLAPRVPLAQDDRILASGEFQWNPRGGVLHWTHHDPQGGRGGWIEYQGKRYQ